MSIPEGSVYSCKGIVNRKLDHMTKDDWALIELDRKVTDRAPLKVRTEGAPVVDQ